jgi:hypothetical protein
MSPSRYLIGLDLGTTNCAVAYVDTTEPLRGGRPTVHRFAIPQIVQPGEVAARDTLPSFLYFPTEEERQAQRLETPARAAGAATGPPRPAAPVGVVGTYARDHGALVPGRQVASAKSWLCNPAVDRAAPILPWGHVDEDAGCSPVEASARYLAHIRDGWNDLHRTLPGSQRFEHQRIVLTVPASFDEEARELTLRAAHDAGLEHVTLLEEPLAAFYAWIASHARSFRRLLRDGDAILICDVGGGTTDFTLVRTTVRGDQVAFERTAIGEHLLLGGDNLDLALAKRLGAKLGRVRLTLRQQQALARLVSTAKEQLLTDRAVDRATIAIPAAGSAMVGGRLAPEITRQEVVDTLRDGFLPLVARDDLPLRNTRAGLREFGLPYATEPAITRHLAAFLTRAALSAEDPASRARGPGPRRGRATGEPERGPQRPDAVLFNGGFFTPDVARDAIVRTLESWFQASDPGWRVKVLTNRNPAGAVATGAAYYGFVREHGGVRVSGGSACAYYVALRDDAPPRPGCVAAVCVMPRGTEEGTTLDLPGRAFTVATNRPIAFPLYSSTMGHDRLGEIVQLDQADVHEHAPLVTILRYGRKSRRAELPVHLSARFTEVGTLEVWCHSDVSEHRWRLQFELRTTEQTSDEDEEPDSDATPPESEALDTAEAGIIIPNDAIDQAAALVRDVFGPETTARPIASAATTPETIVAQIESLFGYGRQAWPLAVIRRLADVLLECMDGRRKGPRFEARWLNLAGFCLRPGFGATLDEWRMEQLRRVYLAGPAFSNDLQVQAEWLVLWQRVAGGLSAGQQQEIHQRYRTLLGIGAKKDVRRLNAQVEREGWRLLASLELLAPALRAALGDQLLDRLGRQPDNPAFLWALGRLGARIPSYGPLNTVVSAVPMTKWLEALLARPRLSSEAQAAIVQMAARTDDPHRDIGDALRVRAIERLAAAGTPAEDIERLRCYVALATSDAIRMFGETLPAGLRLEESA